VEVVEEAVGVEGVVVEEQRPLGTDPRSERERCGDRRVAPALVTRVLLVGVLAVVDQQVGVAGEVVAGDPLLVQVLEVGAEPGLVVGDVAEARVPVGDPVAERRSAMSDRLGADRGCADRSSPCRSRCRSC